MINEWVGTFKEGNMVPASHLKNGMILRLEKNLYKVLGTEYHMGGGKMAGLVHVKLRDIRSDLLLDRKFKPEERLEDVQLDRKAMEFLYENGEGYHLMDPDTYEQIQLDRYLMESFTPFLQPNMRLPVEFLEGEPVNVVFPDWVELKVASTSSSLGSLQDEVYKPATLANGMQVQVPQFIRQGDTVKVDVATKRYIERAKR